MFVPLQYTYILNVCMNQNLHCDVLCLSIVVALCDFVCPDDMDHLCL